MNYANNLSYFSNKWEYRENTANFLGDEMLPDIQRAFGQSGSKAPHHRPPTEDLQRVFDDALDATTDYVMGLIETGMTPTMMTTC